MSLNSVLRESIDAYKPLLDKLDLNTKILLYQTVFNAGSEATEEMHSLACAITADPYFQRWMNEGLKKSTSHNLSQ